LMETDSRVIEGVHPEATPVHVSPTKTFSVEPGISVFPSVEASTNTKKRLSALVYGVAMSPAAEALPGDWPGVEKIGNENVLELPPPGAGFTAVTGIAPAVTISAEEIAAVAPVVPAKSVVRLLPFHSISEQGAHPVPLASSKSAGFPATALDGVTEIIVGTGKEAGAASVNVEELDLTVELETVTFAVPGKAVSAAEIAALSCVALTNVVGRGDPFQLTTKPFTKFVPITVRVNPE